jgi:hypothetical protein
MKNTESESRLEAIFSVLKAGIVLSFVAIASSYLFPQCNKYSEEEIKRNPEPKTVILSISEEPFGKSFQKRFYDLDRDNLTVEQYVEGYARGETIFPNDVKKDLVKNLEEYDYPFHSLSRREMTFEEAEKINLEYQSLLSQNSKE